MVIVIALDVRDVAPLILGHQDVFTDQAILYSQRQYEAPIKFKNLH